MTTTKNGIYYQDNYDAEADVLKDMKKMAESIDEIVEENNEAQEQQNISIEQLNEAVSGLNQGTNSMRTMIINLQKKDIEQDTNIQSLQQEISELEEDVKANSIIVTTEEATSLQINDANGARGKLSVKGNYKQETSEESDNWLDASLFSNETKNGVTLTKQSDGSILLNGTATNSVSFLEKLKRSIRNTDGSHFLKIGKISGTLNGTVYTYLTNSDSSKSTGTPTLTSSNSKASTSIASDVEYTNCLLVVNSGTVLNNVKIYIEVCSSEVDTYIPFTPEKPSKQYPSKIEVVGGNTNILDNTAKSQTINGITFTANKDGSVTAKGTSTAQANFYLTVDENNASEYKDIEKGIYTLSGCDDGNATTYMIHTILQNANSKGERYFSSAVGAVNIEIDQDNKYTTMIVVREGITIDKTFYPKLEKGEKATSYSRPGQAGVCIKKFNKNFTNTSILKSLNAASIEINSKNSFKIDLSKGNLVSVQNRKNILFNAPANLQYTLSYHVEQNNTTFLPALGFAYSDGSIQIAQKQSDASYDTQVTSQEGKEIEGIYLSWGTQNNGGIATISNIQLETGTQKTDFEEYTEEIKTIDIQQEMLKDDYFDLEREKEAHRWNVLELTGDEIWRYEAHVEGKKTIIMKMTIDPALDINSGVCTHFDYIGDYSLDEEHCYAGMSGTLFVFVDYSVISTVEEFKAYLKAQKTAGTPVKVCYKTAETTELDLTETQIEQLEQSNKLRTYKEQTNIVTVEDLALMQLEYSVDIQKYIDNKLANINQQILNLAGGN